MTEIVPSVALLPILHKLADQTQTLRLFTNNVTPDVNTVLADLTEAAWAGYGAVDLVGGEWIDNDPVGGVGLLYHPPVAFLNSTGGDVTAYGYFRLDEAGNLLAVARFDAAPVTKHNGEAFIIIPIMGDVYDVF